jgi:hypothetical protein
MSGSQPTQTGAFDRTGDKPLRRRMIEDMTICKLAHKTAMTRCGGSRTSIQQPESHTRLSVASGVERRRRSRRQHHHRVVLTPEEVRGFLEAAPGIKCLSALSAPFGAARLRDSLTESLQYRFQTHDAAYRARRESLDDLQARRDAPRRRRSDVTAALPLREIERACAP